MSLALALWLITAALYVGYRVGHRNGEAKYAWQVKSDLGPLLPILKELRQDEAEFQRICTAQTEALARLRETAREN